MGSAGCEELSARKKIQEAGKLYTSGKYLEAADLYEKALKQLPGNEIAHHNLALTYHKLFRPGLDTPQNKEYAHKATEHFAIYLESDRENQVIIRMMTGVWMDSGQYERALEFWKHKLDDDPGNVEVIETVANIYRQSGQWEVAIEWFNKLADAQPTETNKAEAYIHIATLTLNKLIYERETIIGMERLRIADIGIAALQRASKLVKENSTIETYLGGLYEHRSYAHGASWAWLADTSAAQYHRKRYVKFQAAEQEKAAKELESQANQTNQDPAKPAGGT